MGGRWKYSVQDLDFERTAIASGRDLRISWKDAVEICRAIKGKRLSEAKNFLSEVIELKTPVPFKRFNRKVAHRRQLSKWHSGRWPQKAAKAILEVLKNAEANALYKGLDVDNLWVAYAIAHKGMKIRKYIPRAFGRATPYFQQLVHVEIVLEER